MVPLPFFGGRRRGARPSDDRATELDRLQKEVEQLRIANEQLKEQLAARSVHLGEYLYKWKTVALPLLGSEWELRYWALSGTTLSYYRSAKDTAFSPREEYSVMSCFVAWEGLRSGRYWTFSLLDSAGSLMVRLAALNRDAAERWLAALEAAGCVRDDSCIPPGGPKGFLEGSAWLRRDASGLERSQSAPSAIKKPPPAAAAGAAAGGPEAEPSTSAAASAAAGAAAGKSKRRASSSSSIRSLGSGSDSGRPPPAPTTPTPTAPIPAERPPSRLSIPSAATDTTTTTATGVPVAASATTAAATREPATAPSSEVGPVPPAATPHPSRRSLGARPGGHGHGGPGGPERGPMAASTPVHTGCRFSLLSSERVWHEKHTGLYNLALIILVLTNFRLALENALKYGWRMNPFRVVGDLMAGRGGVVAAGAGAGAGLAINWPLVGCYPFLMLVAGLSLAAERAGYGLLQREIKLRDALSKKRGEDLGPEAQRALRARAQSHEWLLLLVNVATTCCVIGVPWAVIYCTKAEPVSGGILFSLAVVMWMKLVSYHHCCWDLRAARRGGEVLPGERGCPDTPAEDWGPLARYPENLTLRNLLYFLAVPTLTYQVNYPRSRPLRGRWLLRRLFELTITLTALAIIIGQYIQPTVNNSLAPLRKMDLPRVAERVLKLALPSTYAWLLVFYGLFHLWLNVLAELTRFGDREFYKDWWNAATVGEYWKLWNMPVHKWMLRHVYFPAIRAGCSRFNAVLLTFFVSAVFHELVLGVPLHLVRLWAFGGIMFQVPLIMATDMLRKRLNRDELGNYIFWIAFCVVGQPVCVLLYYHDYTVLTRPTLMASSGAIAGGAAAGVGVGMGAAGGLGLPLLNVSDVSGLANATLAAAAAAAGSVLSGGV